MADVWHGASCLQRVGQRTQNSTGLATWSDLVEIWLVPGIWGFALYLDLWLLGSIFSNAVLSASRSDV